MDINEFFADETPRQPNPRRRQRDYKKEQLRTYGILAVVGVLIILFILFAAGSIKRSNTKREAARQESLAAMESSLAEKAAWDKEAEILLAEASAVAAGYDYEKAMAMIEGFSGSYYEYDALANLMDTCKREQEKLVAWSDPAAIKNLSFNVLIADPDRAFADAENGASYSKNFITVSEFTNIITQLHENGYVLVGLDDFIEATSTEGGVITYTNKPILLPEGKKPIMLTQTQVNYYGYMVDGNDDGTPDKDGAGFANRLVLDANGNLTCEMVDRSGNTVTGAYDMVPILNTFIKAHPDFSYRGARAIVSVSGYDGIFGYRGDALEQAKPIVEALRRDGYTIACYTYGNIAYGTASLKKLQDDLRSWQETIAPLLGQADVLVYAKNSDLETYSGEKFDALTKAGFRFFLGMCTNHESWLQMNSTYIRQGRILVNGANLANNTYFYTGLFDPTSIKDPSR